MARFDANEFNRRMREAQRRAEQEFKREVDRVNRANKRRFYSSYRNICARLNSCSHAGGRAPAPDRRFSRAKYRRMNSSQRAPCTST